MPKNEYELRPLTKDNVHRRRAYLFPLLGIVVKVARISPLLIWRELKQEREMGWSWAFRCLFKEGSTSSPMSGTFLVKGLADNWREFRFYRKTRYPILQPTYFSLFGFVNVQKLGRVLTVEEYRQCDFWPQVARITKYEAAGDDHHFDYPDNFCVVNGRLKMIDYGSKTTQKILRKWANALYEQVSL